ncbi:MAG: DUF4143 domain-containing protein [Candidatus Paracaedibacteraceae bacterium]|nr:DUF4143 domain-containing protein [Candidatus Paracaedibacteraceae bacterium]
MEGYLADYLIPEVQWESRIRQLDAFGRFLEAVGFSNGELMNFSNIARETGVSIKTVQGYVELLVDMLVGHLVFPFAKSERRQLIVSSPKFYFFDTGLIRFLKGNAPIDSLKGSEAGHAFEHYLFLELLAYKELNHKQIDIKYWRTKTGLEVDFILARGTIAIEAKISSPIERRDIKGIVAFSKEHQPQRSIVVSLEPRKRVMNIDDVKIEVFPIEEFLADLWEGKIIP